jgi:hypothetical protein
LTRIKRGEEKHAHPKGEEDEIEHLLAPAFDRKINAGTSIIDLFLVLAA